ncbi:protein TRANSPARENT TESTA 9 [Euphorbia lathyris]|uniref:protein TRANSPARENT TESTA 9 n=1 Tax=Euphorbia lathyris TaxID=212925 RepID=UPI00331330B2
MWFSFWRSRDRFSLDELRYLTDQLQKVQIVNESNKDFVIEALRSIAELITYGDQHDSKFFEFFMDKQIMGEFIRILKVSKSATVSLQLLQTISIMIQNLKSENAIYYMFSNEHINFLISYKFDFRSEELLSYYISFLRAISGKLDKNTISLLVTTQNEEIVSFPLYVEGMRFAFHEENMIRTAVRALTLNIYHVGDESVNRFVAKAPHAGYFSNLVKFFRKQCIHLNELISEVQRNPNTGATSPILATVEEIEDNLYYFSDVISAGIPDVGRLITDNMLEFLILPLLLPSLQMDAVTEIQIGSVTSLYTLCCILRIVKIKDLSNTIAASLFCPPEVFIPKSEAKLNGHLSDHNHVGDAQQTESNNVTELDNCLKVTLPSSASSSDDHPEDSMRNSSSSLGTLRDALLSYIVSGDDLQVLGSLSVLATLLQTKELNELMLDALGILPQRKQQKKLLLQALVGEGSGEDQLFASESVRDSFSCEIDSYLQKMKELHGVCYHPEIGTSPHVHRFQVLDALVSLFCRPDISAETLWDGGWLLRQLLPYSEAEFNNQHLKLLQDSYKSCVGVIIEETKGIWSDLFLTVLCDEWKKCKRAIEASSPPKEPKCILLLLQKSSCDDSLPSESSILAGERMCELVKMFVLLHQLQIFSRGSALPEQPPIYPATDVPENSRARTAGLDVSSPKPGTELKLVDAVPCRIAFERGKERHFCFLAISMGTSGWILLIEELPLKEHHGVVRVVAPLSGSNPRIDEKHSRWLHLRIRPSSLPLNDPAKAVAYRKAKSLVDGRWTLAFRNEESCQCALSMILEEIKLQTDDVERRLKPVLDFQVDVDSK